MELHHILHHYLLQKEVFHLDLHFVNRGHIIFIHQLLNTSQEEHRVFIFTHSQETCSYRTPNNRHKVSHSKDEQCALTVNVEGFLLRNTVNFMEVSSSQTIALAN
jgi:hypothetical protein